MKYLGHGDNKCSMKLTDLKTSDTSIYYFTYSFRNATGYKMTCKGVPGVRLHIFASPVRILAEELVRGQTVLVADWTVIEGQRIMLTCVPTCAAILNSNPGYIWYKNRQQLNSSRANSPYLFLDPISNEDVGSYVCTMIGYKDLPSSAVNLKVQRGPRDGEVSDKIPGSGSKGDSVPASTHGLNGQDLTDQCQEPKGSVMFRFSTMLIATICVGLVITIIVVILVHKVKKREGRRCAASVPRPPNLSNDLYMAINVNNLSTEYDTLDTVKRCSAADTVYENQFQSGSPWDGREVFKKPTVRFAN